MACITEKSDSIKNTKHAWNNTRIRNFEDILKHIEDIMSNDGKRMEIANNAYNSIKNAKKWEQI